MTNVPNDLRDMWREIYVLFDTHYLMDCSKQESWESFWSDGHKLLQKYEYVPNLIEVLSAVSEMISKLYAGRKKDGTVE